MEPVRSHRNSRVVDAARLHRARVRKETGRSLLEGPNLLAEALAAGITPLQVFALADDRDTASLAAGNDFDLLIVDSRAMDRLAGTSTPRGPVAEFEIPESTTLNGSGLVVSWGVSDPGNVGTMIRTASAFGWDFGYATGSADAWSPKVLRAAAGGHFHVAMMHVKSPGQLTDLGYTTVATVVEGGVSPDTLRLARPAVLVGEEAHGLPAGIAAHCDEQVTVPMPGGAESLNAAVAAGIVVYAIANSLAHPEPGSNLPPT